MMVVHGTVVEVSENPEKGVKILRMDGPFMWELYTVPTNCLPSESWVLVPSKARLRKLNPSPNLVGRFAWPHGHSNMTDVTTT